MKGRERQQTEQRAQPSPVTKLDSFAPYKVVQTVLS